jgi:hypothetical protein
MVPGYRVERIHCNFDNNIFQCSYSFCSSSFVAQLRCSIYMHSLRYQEAIAKSRSCFLTAHRIALRTFFVDCPNTCAFHCVGGEGQTSPSGPRCRRKVGPLSSGRKECPLASISVSNESILKHIKDLEK